MLNIECPIARQSSIAIFLRHPVYTEVQDESRKVMPFIFKLALNLLLELDMYNFHVYSQQDVVTIVGKKSSMSISTVLLILARLERVLTPQRIRFMFYIDCSLI